MYVVSRPLPAAASVRPCKKQGDLYALECALLEVGRWGSLQRVLLLALRRKRGGFRVSRGLELGIDGRWEVAELSEKKRMRMNYEADGSLMKELEFMPGRKYASMVLACVGSGVLDCIS